MLYRNKSLQLIEKSKKLTHGRCILLKHKQKIIIFEIKIMENSLFEFGIKIVLSICGVFLYSVWQVRDKILEFNPKKFINDNKGYWIWVFIIQLLAAIILLASPESSEFLLNFTGIDFSKAAAFLTSGILLSRLANGITDDKIGVKPTGGGDMPDPRKEEK